MFLVEMGVLAPILAVLSFYFGERYNSLIMSLPDWLLVLISFAIGLGFFVLFRHSYLNNKRRMRSRPPSEESGEETTQHFLVYCQGLLFGDSDLKWSGGRWSEH